MAAAGSRGARGTGDGGRSEGRVADEVVLLLPLLVLGADDGLCEVSGCGIGGLRGLRQRRCRCHGLGTLIGLALLLLALLQLALLLFALRWMDASVMASRTAA